MNSKKRILGVIAYLLSVVVLVGIDQITKYLAVVNLKGKNPFVIIKGVFEFCYLQNDGAAWGMMSGARTLFLIITPIIIALITYIWIKTPLEKRYLPVRVVLILLCAGAAGNMIDRALHRYVHDFIYFKLINFPIFNVADIYVTVSMIILIILILFVYEEHDFAYLSPRNKQNNQ